MTRAESTPLLPKNEGDIEISSSGSLWRVLPAMIGVFVAAMDSTVGLTVYETVASDFNQLFNANWIPIVYFLSSFSCMPLYYTLIRRYGWKQTFLLAQVAFGIGAFCTSLSETFICLLISRATVGIGGGFMISMGPIVLFSDSTRSHLRPTYKLCFGIALSLGCAIGSPLGGYFSVFYSWRNAFLLECILVLCLICFCLPAHRVRNLIDSISPAPNVLWITTLFAPLLSLVYLLDKPILRQTDWIIITSILIFILLLLLRAIKPLLTPPILITFFCSALTSAGAYHISLFQQTVFLKPAHMAGAWLTPAVFGALFGSLYGGNMIVGATVQLVGTAVALLHVGIIKKQLVGLVSGWVLTNIGNGIVLSNVSTPPTSCEDKQSWTISLAGARTLGSSFGVVIGFTISKHTVLNYISLDKIPVSLEILRLPEQSYAVEAYEMGVRSTMWCIVGLACLMLLGMITNKVLMRK